MAPIASTLEGRLGALLLTGALLTACTDFTVETTLRADGSGVREMRAEISSMSSEDRANADLYRTLLHLTEGDGWQYTPEVNERGATTHVFHRRDEIADPAAWSGMSGTVAVDGALPDDADGRFGYVRAGDVKLRNEVHVEQTTAEDGTTTLAYRETFSWDQGLDLFLEIPVVGMDHRLREAYPALTDEDRGQILGVLRAHVWANYDDVEHGLMEDEDAFFDVTARQTTRRATRILQARYPELDESEIEEFFLETLADLDIGNESLEDEMAKVPGWTLAGNTSIEFRLTMPGDLLESNADEEEDGVLIWVIDAEDLGRGPVEIRAASRVGGS